MRLRTTYDPVMTRYLHTMYRITDPEKSRAFYEALGMEFRRDMDIVRGGEKEATNYFFGVPGQEEELELTLNHDWRTYDLGTSESPRDSPLILGEDARTVFLGDQIYDHKHCYLADGFYEEWLRNIETLRTRFPEDAVFYIGHGGPVGGEMWDWQREYIERGAAEPDAATPRS